MMTYEIDSDPVSGPVSDDLWRLEFRAPIDGQQVLCWVDNICHASALEFQQSWRRDPNLRRFFCRRCNSEEEIRDHPREHDALPEERGWHNRDITQIRIMPMREAI